jgi:hypothetical protein
MYSFDPIYLTKAVTAAAFEAPHWCILCDKKPGSSSYMSPEVQNFLSTGNHCQKQNSGQKSEEFFSLLFTVTSTVQLCLDIYISSNSPNLLCIYSNSRNLLCISTVQLLCTVKEKAIPLSWFKKSTQKPPF